MINNSLNPILLVEDRLTDLDLTKRAFARSHLLNPIEVARDGEQAIAHIERWNAGAPLPVFILLDLKIPKLSGLEVLKEIKSHERYAKIPVIVLTTSKEDGDIMEAYRLGCNSYIVKPVEFKKFMEVAAQIEIYWCALNSSPTL